MQKIWQEAEAMQPELVERRRDLHRHPETGWTEFRTAAMVVKELQALGYDVYMGSDALVEAEMMGLPNNEVLEKAMARAVSEGADAALVEKCSGGKTGVVGVMKLAKPGKTVAFRVDMDCNDVEECTATRIAAGRRVPLAAHQCHATPAATTDTSPSAWAWLKCSPTIKKKLAGTVKLIFQPRLKKA